MAVRSGRGGQGLKVAVIGGGIQGTCVAMELATRGIEVDVMESNPALMDAASRHNEGKIHLGFVYANDPTFRTAGLMFRGAVEFAHLMRRWLGTAFEDIPVSTPFNYAVHHESLMPPDSLEKAYKEIARRLTRRSRPGDYFGVDDPGVVTRLRGSEHDYGLMIDEVFVTQEIAVSPVPLADLITKTVVDCDGIGVMTDTAVTAVDAGRRLIEVSTADGTAGRSLGPYDHIINCAWAGRPALDVTAGLPMHRPWTFRMKYYLSATAPPGYPPFSSTTVVLGAFGDIVDYGNSEYYLSWYPSGRRGWSRDLVPPPWPTRPSPAVANDIARDTLTSLESIYPNLTGLTTHGPDAPVVRGGVIFSLGTTDVDDPDSEFHRRSEVGVTSSGAYHSVDTGKYTTAPLFAIDVADRVVASK